MLHQSATPANTNAPAVCVDTVCEPNGKLPRVQRGLLSRLMLLVVQRGLLARSRLPAVQRGATTSCPAPRRVNATATVPVPVSGRVDATASVPVPVSGHVDAEAVATPVPVSAPRQGNNKPLESSALTAGGIFVLAVFVPVPQ